MACSRPPKIYDSSSVVLPSNFSVSASASRRVRWTTPSRGSGKTERCRSRAARQGVRFRRILDAGLHVREADDELTNDRDASVASEDALHVRVHQSPQFRILLSIRHGLHHTTNATDEPVSAWAHSALAAATRPSGNRRLGTSSDAPIWARWPRGRWRRSVPIFCAEARRHLAPGVHQPGLLRAAGSIAAPGCPVRRPRQPAPRVRASRRPLP